MRLLLTATVIFVIMSDFVNADSPIDKGSVIIGGQIFYQKQSGDLYQSYPDQWGLIDRDAFDPISTQVINTEFGYFISRGLMVGLDATVSHISQGRIENTEFGIGPKVGFYMDANPGREKIGGSVYPYLNVLFTIGTRDSQLSATPKRSMRFGGQLGFMTMISRTLGLDIALRITKDYLQLGGASQKGTTISAGAGITGFIH